MRWTQTLIPTLKETPKEAEIPSHQLMLRAGLINKLAGGLYTFLPLGLRALRNVERIVREEMDRAGALELLMPALQPREIWDKSGRYNALTDVMFRIRDRQERHMVLGPTHEEVVTDLAAHTLNSYRQLPKNFYQIQTKFRDEIRPRFGLMRAKEFIMKDAYSFDTSPEALEKSYQAMYDAYVRIFARCGLRAKVVEADSGAMGGSCSHEFMVLAETGEDGLAECDSCAYAANLERAERALRDVPAGAPDQAQPIEVATPGMKTIEAVSSFLKVQPADLVKTLIYVTGGKPIAVLVPGDRDLNEHKLIRALDGAPVQMADESTILRATGAPIGFAGPAGLDIPVYADLALRGRSGMVTGANKADAHLLHVDLARDAKITGFFDLVVVCAGDQCPRCSGRLQEKRGIEVGHVFKLGTKYSTAFDATFLDDAGQPHPMIMGCYGIGVTRTLQAVVEQNYDANGIIWPAAVAPYQVALLALNIQHEPTRKAAGEVNDTLEAAGISVLYDDRDERAGFKFKDADLLGLPVRVVISERNLAQGKVEIKRRDSKNAQLVPVAALLETVRAMLQSVPAK